MGKNTSRPHDQKTQYRSRKNKEVFSPRARRNEFQIRQELGHFERRWNVTKNKWEHQKVDQADLDYYEKIEGHILPAEGINRVDG